MSILIKDFKIPSEDDPKTFLTHFNKDGTAEMVAVGYPQVMYSIIAVPDDHGRLIDADELRKEYKKPMDWLDQKQVVYHVTGIWSSIDNAPTVIPADKESES